MALADRFGFSLSEKSKQLMVATKLNQLISFGSVLSTPGLPEAKAAELRVLVIECLTSGKELIEDELPEEHRHVLMNAPESVSNATLAAVLSSLEKKKLSYRERLSPHGWRMVQMVMREGKIVDFVRLWRQHFLDTMKPKMMPYAWEQCPEVYAVFGVSKPSEEEIAKAAKQRMLQCSPD